MIVKLILLLWFVNIFVLIFSNRYYKSFNQFYKFLREPDHISLNKHFQIWNGYIDIYRELSDIKNSLIGRYPPQDILFIPRNYYYYYYGNYAIYPYRLILKKNYRMHGGELPGPPSSSELKNFKLAINIVNHHFKLIKGEKK